MLDKEDSELSENIILDLFIIELNLEYIPEWAICINML
jgi:hypothetical protein